MDDGDGADDEPRYPGRHGAYSAAAAALTAAVAAGAWERDLQSLRRGVPPAGRVPHAVPEVRPRILCTLAAEGQNWNSCCLAEEP